MEQDGGTAVKRYLDHDRQEVDQETRGERRPSDHHLLLSTHFRFKMDRQRFVRLLQKRIPILGWMPFYDKEKFIADLIAGVTVGLTVMPQSLAYATLAGLQPQYGLYSAFMGCFVYALLGSCKDITIGPTALMALMTYQQVIGRNADFAVLLAFLTGCVQLLMALLQLGVLVDFISIPVTVGFTSATSVMIAVSQLKGLLGLNFKANGFVDTIRCVWRELPNFNLADTILGITCMIILLLLRRLKDIRPGGANPSRKQQIAGKSIWLLSTSRNALLVFACSFMTYLWTYYAESTPYSLTGEVASGLPEFSLPPFYTQLGNQSYNFGEMVEALGTSIVLVPIIAVLGNVAIAKAFASGDSIDATQELMTLGLCNLFGSFAHAFPVTGSFSRSAVNHASGVRTPLGGVYTGILILLALSLLTPYFYYIPKACLAAVIICAVIFMIEYEVIRPMWRSSRKDLVPAFATFILCLGLGVELGILVGVGINMVFLVYPSARPALHVERAKTSKGKEYLLIQPANSLLFPAVDFVRVSVAKVAKREGGSQLPVVVDCRFIHMADFTAAKGMGALIEDLSKRKQRLLFFQPNSQVVSVFKGAAIEEFVHVCSQEELEYLLHENSNGDLNDAAIELVEVKATNNNSTRESASLQPLLPKSDILKADFKLMSAS